MTHVCESTCDRDVCVTCRLFTGGSNLLHGLFHCHHHGQCRHAVFLWHLHCHSCWRKQVTVHWTQVMLHWRQDLLHQTQHTLCNTCSIKPNILHQTQGTIYNTCAIKPNVLHQTQDRQNMVCSIEHQTCSTEHKTCFTEHKTYFIKHTFHQTVTY